MGNMAAVGGSYTVTSPFSVNDNKPVSTPTIKQPVIKSKAESAIDSLLAELTKAQTGVLDAQKKQAERSELARTDSEAQTRESQKRLTDDLLASLRDASLVSTATKYQAFT